MSHIRSSARFRHYRRFLDSAGSQVPTTRAREPEARRAQRTEADGDQEGDAIAPGQVVHDTAEPRRDTTADAVAHAQDAVNGAEAPPREELGRHRGDDGATGTEAEAEEERIGVEGRRVRPHLESKQAERPHCGAAVRDGGRCGAPSTPKRDRKSTRLNSSHPPCSY